MPRLFSGLELPASVAGYLGMLRNGLPGARFIEPADYHITLRFFGDVGYAVANDLADMLDLSARRFSLRIAELGSFGKDTPHALVAMIAPSPELSELQHDHDRIAKKLKLPPDARKFTPHITIARLKPGAAPHVGEWIVHNSPPLSQPFEITRVALFSSRNSIGGGPYIVEKNYPLDAR